MLNDYGNNAPGVVCDECHRANVLCMCKEGPTHQRERKRASKVAARVAAPMPRKIKGTAFTPKSGVGKKMRKKMKKAAANESIPKWLRLKQKRLQEAKQLKRINDSKQQANQKEYEQRMGQYRMNVKPLTPEQLQAQENLFPRKRRPQPMPKPSENPPNIAPGYGIDEWREQD